MAHFAKLDDNNIVVDVQVAEQDFIDTLQGRWIQTSYNTHGGLHYNNKTKKVDGVGFRYNYAGIGYLYDETKDAFIPPQPYLSWTLSTETCLWEPPVAYPNDGDTYFWNEETLSWDTVETE
jgi:hypothetical protein